LNDSINQRADKMLEDETSINGILQAIVDNQIEVENKVLKAIEDAR